MTASEAADRSRAGFQPAPIATLLTWDVSIFRHPAEVVEVQRVFVGGVEVASLNSRSLSRDNLFDVTFDEVLDRLARQPRTDVEPDGFFVRSGEVGGRVWRASGHLFELGDRLWRVDLRGEATLAAFEDLLSVLGWPRTPLVFQLVQHGVTLDEANFRRWMAVVENQRFPANA